MIISKRLTPRQTTRKGEDIQRPFMQFRLRFPGILACLLLLSVFPVPMAIAQQNPPANPPATSSTLSAEDKPFEKAIQLEKDNRRDDAIAEYRKIANENRGKNNELAAEALYRLRLYRMERYPATTVERHKGQDDAATGL